MFALELSMEKLIKKFWMTLKNVYAVIASPFTDRIESCVRKKMPMALLHKPLCRYVRQI